MGRNDWMLNRLKKFYWFMESFFFEIKARFFLFPIRNQKKHGLPGPLIISLTSYPPRFKKLHLTIKTLITQTMACDQLVLWIADADYSKLPETILKLNGKNGFEVRKCQDLRSFKKIIPLLEQKPDAFIVTADDDVYYEKCWLERMVRAWDGSMKSVVAHRVHEVIFENTGNPAEYRKWKFNIESPKSTKLAFATGCGGVFYPPGSLHPDVLDSSLFMELCPSADDVWLFWMARRNDSITLKVPGMLNVVTWLGSQTQALLKENVNASANDIQIKKMIQKMGWPVSD